MKRTSVVEHNLYFARVISLRLQKIRRTIESLHALKSPRLVKKPASEDKPAGLEKAGGPLAV
jgi:hypothetical protein